VPATAILAKQRVAGLLRGLLRRFQRTGGDQTWLLPNGAAAQQCGARQTDLVLVWPQNETDDVDDARLQAVWPRANRFQKLGKRLFLVSGVEPPAPADVSMPPQGSPCEPAEQILAAARRASARRGEP